MSAESHSVTDWMAKSIAIRSRTAESIAPTDRIEVYLLDPAKEPSGLGRFPLRPYGQ
jgi:hypothetical protein